MSQRMLATILIGGFVLLFAFNFVRNASNPDTSSPNAATIVAIQSATTCPAIRSYWDLYKNDDTRAGKAYAVAAASQMKAFGC